MARIVRNLKLCMKLMNFGSCRKAPSVFLPGCKHHYSTNVVPLKLSYSAHGEPNNNLRPLIITHGLFGSRVNWHSIGKALAKKTQRQVFCLDVRNHGQSPHSPEMTYFHMSADFRTFISDHCPPSAVVIGHSMGGRAAMVLALTEPSVVDRLIVVDISPTRSSPNLGKMKEYFQALLDLRLQPGLSLSDARKAADAKLAENIEDPRIRQFLLMNIEGIEKDGQINWRINLKALTENFGNICNFPKIEHIKYTGSTLFVSGELSDYLGPEDMPGIVDWFPTADLKVVPKANHWVHADNPNYFVEIVAEFLKS